MTSTAIAAVAAMFVVAIAPPADAAFSPSEMILAPSMRAADMERIQVVLENKVIRQRLQTIDGVGLVKIFGEKRYSMRLWLDPYKMVATGITATDVQKALVKELFKNR